ncbi:DUF309 domain-containing protein [Hazenella coriacea]|uniref:DUF309 domain-containing protein n=1 Tax=Hazenella coriacea TaxID=1179467 RepID=A0A4R3L5W7_9BACL|nr:DUF309 domain-containing protein [Hazenella coriacea]TCS95083.1 hypothetical protein EDD58_103509 [Hazenella coriacea]
MSSSIYHPLYIQFFTHYHREEYWEAHEVLEELWQTQRHNRFYHGLIQIAAIMHQLKKGKVRGARKLATTAQGYLESYAPYTEGVEVSQVLEWLHHCLEVLPQSIEKMSWSEIEQLGIQTCPLPDISHSSSESTSD